MNWVAKPLQFLSKNDLLYFVDKHCIELKSIVNIWLFPGSYKINTDGPNEQAQTKNKAHPLPNLKNIIGQ